MKLIFLGHPQNRPNRTHEVIRLVAACWLLLIFSLTRLPAQEVFELTAPGKYLVSFTDKQYSPFSADNPAEFLSQKALERRKNQGIPITHNDLPVSQVYIDSLKWAGAKVLHTSKWLNTATIQVSDSLILDRISGFGFVRKTTTALNKQSYHSRKKAASGTKEADTPASLEYGASWLQTAIHHGQHMHAHGYTGKGITIAVLDAGFSEVDRLPVFSNIREDGRILGTRSYVLPGESVFGHSTHGMSVLSVIGGWQPGELVGAAPDAYFYLLRTEDASSEFIIEEDNWIAAAEFADSAGADIINTSLGYSLFDNQDQNHLYSDMDGNTTRISRAADIAASKGMLVVVSAGNEGNSAWKYITAPGDADSVLTVGAVDPYLDVAEFSSRGPSSDNQVKPEVMAIGKGIYVARPDETIRPGNGTSYSAPLITGLAACLWQANREASAMEIRQAICESADRYNQPDDEFGFGIPDFNLANILLQMGQENSTVDQVVTLFPNPFNRLLYVVFRNTTSAPVDISLYDISGKEMLHAIYPQVEGRNYVKLEGELAGLPRGAYIIRIRSGELSENCKLFKF
ncbi:MAG: S8 family serine peptidase [Bacteroidales bacterium]